MENQTGKKRGRPSIDKDVQQAEIIKNNVFSRTFNNSDGTVDIWYYDYNKYPNNGLYKTEMNVSKKINKNKNEVIN